MADAIADVCIVGVGGMGGIIAKELASAGLKVVGFERGPAPKIEDYAPRDSIRFLIRPEQLEWVRHEPTTTRKRPVKKPTCSIAPVRFNVLGGALLHWTGQSSRYMPGDFKFTPTRSRAAMRSAPRRTSPATILSTGRSATTISNLTTKSFEWEFGVSGQAGANPFAGPRRRGFPLPPLRHSAQDEAVR